MAKTLAVIFALAATTLARVTGSNAVHHIFVPEEFQDLPLVGSIVTAVPTQTEYRLHCNPTAALDSCDIGTGASVTMRPGDYEFGIEDGDDISMNERCSIAQGMGVCVHTAMSNGVTTATKTDGFFSMVTITGGFQRATDPIELRIRALLEEEDDDDECEAYESYSYPASSSSASNSASYSTSGSPSYTTKSSGPSGITSVYSTDTPATTSIVSETDGSGNVIETSTDMVTVTPSNSELPASTTAPVQGGASARPSQGVVLTSVAALLAAVAVAFL